MRKYVCGGKVAVKKYFSGSKNIFLENIKKQGIFQKIDNSFNKYKGQDNQMNILDQKLAKSNKDY